MFSRIIVAPTRQKLFLNAFGAAALVAFITALFLIPPYRPPAPLPGPVAATTAPAATQTALSLQEPPEDHLAAVATALQEAQTALRHATIANKGGFVEKARADANQSLADLAEALAYIQAHPELKNQPAPPLTAELAAQFAVDHQGHPLPTTGFPNLFNALDALRSASGELQLTPGGDLGGFRAKLTKDILQTASDTISGLEVATSGSPGGG